MDHCCLLQSDLSRLCDTTACAQLTSLRHCQHRHTCHTHLCIVDSEASSCVLLQMADAAEESFSTFLNSKPVIEAPDTAAVLDSSSSLQASQHPSGSQASPNPTQPTPSSSAEPQPPPKSDTLSEATAPGPSPAPSSAAGGHLSTTGQASGKQSEKAQGQLLEPKCKSWAAGLYLLLCAYQPLQQSANAHLLASEHIHMEKCNKTDSQCLRHTY